ncbi:uncharacterized PKHD-type hydroxylase At1g22950 [Brachypodium distachyon]|uniref:uncharacterized PKHD-type hydroxylase At1g22950 n=1 Tax=Brachypodium distachyon TaxID=15368 RepID=UPI000D0D8501|nr:uncharacterized PKHD-type hydroxylase At1g22950 [Brachypodium distachyon]|eukprot:XP_014754391.2 uncharacterized PKHD-type hydroxylase At1g22950 [Brachypodium distachyon]
MRILLRSIPEEFSDALDGRPEVFEVMEQHLPLALYNAPRDVKLSFMRRILARDTPPPRALREIEITMHRQKRLSSYEVQNFYMWACTTKQKILRTNALNTSPYGVVLSDMGMQGVLDDLMKQFVSPISTVFFSEVGGGSLDSHVSFVNLYHGDDNNGTDWHVDDSEVTLSVCLGKEFTGGEMYFNGRRCENHTTSMEKDEEKVIHPQVPGEALLHHGRHRHSVFPTFSGFRADMTMWCRSSVFRELRKYKTDFSNWCGECKNLGVQM